MSREDVCDVVRLGFARRMLEVWLISINWEERWTGWLKTVCLGSFHFASSSQSHPSNKSSSALTRRWSPRIYNPLRSITEDCPDWFIFSILHLTIPSPQKKHTKERGGNDRKKRGGIKLDSCILLNFLVNSYFNTFLWWEEWGWEVHTTV